MIEKETKQPIILITNDDGIDAKGITMLTDLMGKIAKVVVVAPDGPRSAQSSALTVTHPIRFRKVDETERIVRYSCTGTPTDCIKLALDEIMDVQPDIIVSGINHGSNSAVNVIYSGTMGAVLEGCEHGIPSVGFSLCSYDPDADFSHFGPYITRLTLDVIKHGLPRGVCLNVNAPAAAIRGVKMCRQCDGRWTREFAKRTDPHGRAYYWLTGLFENHEPEANDTDEWALNNGYVSVVPVKIDMTAYDVMKHLGEWVEAE